MYRESYVHSSDSEDGDGVLGWVVPRLGWSEGPCRGQSEGSPGVVIVVLMCVWKSLLLARLGSVANSSCPGTGCCRKACGGRSGRASLGSLSEMLGMGRAGSRMAFPLKSTHIQLVSPEVRQVNRTERILNLKKSGKRQANTDKHRPRHMVAFSLKQKNTSKQANKKHYAG